jgi:hypothetical protein
MPVSGPVTLGRTSATSDHRRKTMPDDDDRQEEPRDPVGAQLPGAKEKPAEADHQDEPTEIQDGGE